MIKPVDGPITSRWNQMRPLKANIKTHVHGAIDIAAPMGAEIKAPDRGELIYVCSLRPPKSKYRWKEWTRNYFYDVYGGLILIKNEAKTHIIAHCEITDLFINGTTDIMEEGKNKRFKSLFIEKREGEVSVGDVIGYVGNAGYSTGPHIHWEIHNGNEWNRWEKRPDPERYI